VCQRADLANKDDSASENPGRSGDDRISLAFLVNSAVVSKTPRGD
jgi:hypothetical protein